MSLKDVDDLPYEDAVNIWEMYQTGIVGPALQLATAYNNYAMIHNLTEVLTAVNSKNYKPKAPKEFKEVFSSQYSVLACEPPRKKLSLGTQGVIAMMSDPNMPAWMREKAQEELDGSRRDSNTG